MVNAAAQLPQLVLLGKLEDRSVVFSPGGVLGVENLMPAAAYLAAQVLAQLVVEVSGGESVRTHGVPS